MSTHNDHTEENKNQDNESEGDQHVKENGLHTQNSEAETTRDTATDEDDGSVDINYDENDRKEESDHESDEEKADFEDEHDPTVLHEGNVGNGVNHTQVDINEEYCSENEDEEQVILSAIVSMPCYLPPLPIQK